MTFAERFKAARKATGLSQERAARIVGVTGGCVARWEEGRAKPYPYAEEAVLAKLVEAKAERQAEDAAEEKRMEAKAATAAPDPSCTKEERIAEKSENPA
jgi:transcriptional regulator with XRE-family HTH domain